MSFLSSLLGIVAPIGQSLLNNELQRKSARRQARTSQQSFPMNPFDLAPPAGLFNRSTSGPLRTPPSNGVSSSGAPIFNPGAFTSKRAYKREVCRAVKRLELHPAQATAMLKMQGLKGCTRRLNPLNPRALTRAARRMEGFLRTVKRIEKAIPTKTRRARSRGDHTHALQSAGVVRTG